MIHRLQALLRHPSVRALVPWLALAVLVYAVTSIPYLLASRHAPPGMAFHDGLIWQSDQDAYFSFIRQSADGHFLFANRMTSVEHRPAFFNLEWLLVGWVMALFHGSTTWAYQLWRFAGALSVTCGLFALAQVALERPALRRIAMLMGLLGGAFHTLYFGLNGISRLVERATGLHAGRLTADFIYITVHPYAQILVNPHFTLPLGCFLLAIAAYIKGELTGNWRWYLGAGGLALVEAMMRPYELMVVYTALPLFVVVETIVARRIEWRKVWHRVLPLLVVAPQFLYTVYIFEVHPVFKYWSSQGVDPPEPVSTTFALMGLGGLLVIVRLFLIRKFPLRTTTERFLLVWLATVFFFIHANAIPFLRFMPYSPQLTTSLMPAAILLGVVLLDPARWRWGAGRPVLQKLLVAGLVAWNAVDSLALLYTINHPDAPTEQARYIPVTELEGYRWLDREASEDDVVFALAETGHRLVKYASVHVVVGHWSVTPHAAELEAYGQRFFRGEMDPAVAAEFLGQQRVKWIYLGASERKLGSGRIDQIPGFTRRVINDDVTVYSANR